MKTFLKLYLLPALFLIAAIPTAIYQEYLLSFAYIIVAIDWVLFVKLRVKYREFQELVCKVLTPGDLADRVAIANIKCDRLGDTPELLNQWDNAYQLLMALYPEFRSDKERNHLRGDLTKINNEQWDWEDRVRTEKSVEACLDARECNNRRVAKKNEINKLFEADIEIKSYKGE